MNEPTKVCQSTKNEIYLNQKKRIEEGGIVVYKDGKEYWEAVGYPVVLVSALKSYLKGFGMSSLIPEIK